MSEKHIKENKILTSTGKIICCCGEQINAVIKGDAEAMFFVYIIPSDLRFFCFEAG